MLNDDGAYLKAVIVTPAVSKKNECYDGIYLKGVIVTRAVSKNTC